MNADHIQKSIPDSSQEDTMRDPHFSISAHVVVQLGEELVTDVEQALLELAKNAYDADSESCEIKVEPNWELTPQDDAYELLFGKKKGEPIAVGRVCIRDFGTGLTQEAVQHGWLRISASLKRGDGSRSKNKTAKGRTPVGDKGLGRLATMKLGKVLRMKTAIEGEVHWRTVTFSWNDFTQDRALEQVRVLTGTEITNDTTTAGTIIEVIGLHEQERWSDSAYIEKHLIPHLSSLINPFKTSDSFDISLNVGRQNHELHSLDEEVLNLSSAKFSFTWDGRQMKQESWIAPSLVRGERGEENEKRFKEMFSDKEKPQLVKWLQSDKKLQNQGLSFSVGQPWLCSFSDVLNGDPLPADRKFPGAVNPGPFKATIYYFMFHEMVKQKLAQAKVSTETIQAMSQVAIFRDGFRVRAHRDWLRLAEGTTSGSSFYGLRPANVIGYFSVTNEHNSGLVEKSDREGFVDNPEFRGFMVLGLRARDYANNVLEMVRKSVRGYIKARDHGEEPDTRKALVDTLAATKSRTEDNFAYLQTELAQTRKALDESQRAAQLLASIADNPSADDFGKSVVAAEAHLGEVSKVITEIGLGIQRQSQTSIKLAELSQDDEDYAARLLDAAAVGLVARSLAHELHEYLRQLRDGVAIINSANKKLKNADLTAAIRGLQGTTRELAKTISTIDPLLPGTRSIKENIGLRKFLTDYVDAREATVEKAGVMLSLHLPPDGEEQIVRFSRTRLLQIIENLFQNSLYWLRHGPLPEKDMRRIDISLSRTGIQWSDTGPGVRPSLEASIFDPYVSDKSRSEASGIGLHVVTTFLEMEKCTIRLSEKRNALGRKYEFELDMSGALVEFQQPDLGV